MNFTRTEIIELLSMNGPDELAWLFRSADMMRRLNVGDEVHLRGIIEYSNHCRRNCLYCGLRRGNREIARYRMPDDEVVTQALKIREAGIMTVVLQAGEDEYDSTARVGELVARVKNATGLTITLSIGERPYEDYRAFRDAGADRYLLKHETSSPELYQRLHPDSHYDNRLQCLHWLKELGYETGAGNMVGLPGQTIETLADDILLMRALDIDMIGIGPFIAHPRTPLADRPIGNIELVLKVIAVTRLVTGNTNIPATTALATLDPQGRMKALQAGANIVMPDFTPTAYKELYEIYPGRGKVAPDIQAFLAKLESDLDSIGRRIGKGRGERVTATTIRRRREWGE